jgi:hypothetical protein
VFSGEEIGHGRRSQAPHALRAFSRAWSWRRRLERGEVLILAEVVKSEKLSEQFVGQIMRLAYLAPELNE